MSIERILLPDNVLDRVADLERRLAELETGAVTVQVVQVPSSGGESGLNGWVATGSTFADLLGRIVLDASLPGIKIGAGGIIYSADYAAGVSGFRIDGGVAEFNDVTIRGTVHASAGSIGGWTIASGHLYAGSGSSRAGLRPADYPFYAGAENPASASFRVTPAGVLTATDATVTGTIYATGGYFSGVVTVGSSSPYIQIDGANKRIRTSTYMPGLQGFNLDGTTGDAEFNNVDIRGALKASVFEYAQSLVMGGTLTIAKAGGKLYADCTSVDSPNTFNVDVEDPDGISHAAAGNLWATNDIVRLKDALVGDLWAKVSSKTDMTTYWRLVVVKQSPGAGTNYTFRRGMAVVNYGQSGQGFLVLTADQGSAPFYSVRSHSGSPWTAQTELARMGNLNGNWGYSSAVYGIALGEYASGKASMTWDSTNGLRLRTYSTTVLQLDNSGNADITGKLCMSGTSSALAIGSTPPTSSSSGTGIWIDRTGFFSLNAGMYQVKIDTTDGKLYAGGGNIAISAAGMRMLAISGTPDTTKLAFVDTTFSGAVVAEIYAEPGSRDILHLDSDDYIDLTADSNLTRLTNSYISTGEDLRVAGGVYVGGIDTDPPAGEILTTGAIVIGGSSHPDGTLGLTINQGGYDNDIITLRSSDVAHGMTDLVSTDVYGSIRKADADSGGLAIRGLTESTTGVWIGAYYTSGNTTKSTSGRAGAELYVAKKSGTGTGSPGANENLFAIRAYGTTRMIVDNEGDIYYDGTLNAYDDYDDLALLTDLRRAISAGFGEVHPHTRGECFNPLLTAFATPGPPPHAWGMHSRSPGCQSLPAVHPHTRGECPDKRGRATAE